MKKSIILEGPNGSGKSTLREALGNCLGMIWHHAGPNPGDTREALKACCQQYSWITDGRIVDRVTPISRPVYDSESGGIEADMLASFLDIMLDDAVVIYCTAEGEFSDKSYYPPGHFERVKKDAAKIRASYEMIMHDVPHIKYDWREKTLEELVKEIWK